MVSLASNPFKASSVLCRSKESFPQYGSKVISSIRLSGCLYVILAIRAVMFWLIVCSWGGALGTWVSIRLTFVLLLDVYIAQAHQSHLEAENTHFSVPSTEGTKKKEKRRERNCKVTVFELWVIWNCNILCLCNTFIRWLNPAGRDKMWRNYVGQSSIV